MKFLKILISDISLASRDKKEIQLFFENKYNINIIYKKTLYSKDSQYKYNNHFHYQAMNTYKIKIPILNKILKLFHVINFSLRAYKIKADVISGHDLIGLFIAYLSSIFRFKKPKLIYDSHEYELGLTGRGKISKFFVYHLEKYLIKRADLVIMVNDSIAEKVQSVYQLKDKPLVIRNIPHYWHLEPSISKLNRQTFLKKLNLNENAFLVMYHGGISPNRGIQKLLEAVSKIDNVGVIILGYGQSETLEMLRELSEQLDIGKRVLFHDAVAIDELWKYVSAVDVGVSLAPNINLNHYYMLPNKLFENIQSLTPLIASDFPEIRKIIKGYDIGLLVDPENPDEIAKAIQTMREDKEQYTQFKLNLKKAKEELHWDIEKQKLQVKIRDILYEK